MKWKYTETQRDSTQLSLFIYYMKYIFMFIFIEFIGVALVNKIT